MNSLGLEKEGMPPNWANSIMIPQGFSVTLFDQPDLLYLDKSITLDGEDFLDVFQAMKCINLSEYGYVDKASSLKIRRTENTRALAKWERLADAAVVYEGDMRKVDYDWGVFFTIEDPAAREKARYKMELDLKAGLDFEGYGDG